MISLIFSLWIVAGLSGGLDPLDSFAHFPNTLALFAFFDVNSFAMLLALAPFSDVLASIWPLKSAMSVLLVILIATYISPSVAPRKGAFAFHLIVYPLAIVDSSVGPSILAFSVDVVLEEVSIIGTLVRPDELASAMFHSLLILTVVLGAV